MLTVDVKAIQDGTTVMVHYKGDHAYRDAIKQAREWQVEGFSDVTIDGSRDMTMLEFATSFTIMYVDPETGFEHHENRAIHLDFVERQDADRVWSVVDKLEGSGLDMVIGYLPSEHRYIVTEEPWIKGINAVNFLPDPKLENPKRPEQDPKDLLDQARSSQSPSLGA